MGRKLSGSAPGLCLLFEKGAWVPISHTVPFAEAYVHIKWHLDASSRLATIKMGRKLGSGLHPLVGRAPGSPSNTESPGLRHTFVPSGIFNHPAAWPQ